VNFESFLAAKYIKSNRSNKFISFSSLISIIGIILGVAALIVTMGVMNGFDKELEKKIMGVNPNVFVKSFSGVFSYDKNMIEDIETRREVKYVYPLLTTQCIVSSGKFSSGAVLNGIVLKKSGEIKKYIIGSTKGAVVGSELMRVLGLKTTDDIRIILPFGKTTPFGFAPLSFKEKVTGIFKSGMYDYDTTFIYLPIKDVWSKTEMKGKINTIAIVLKDPYKAREFSNRLAKDLGFNFYVSNWIDLNSNFFSALKLEKFALFVILLLVILVAAFNITSSLTMLVMEKVKDVAVLMAFGATEKNIKNIFIKQAVIIGTIGVALGDILGVTISFLLKKYQFIQLPKDVYYISTIPVDINPYYILTISVLTFVLVVLASIYPAKKASKVDIVEVLRS
jgi:lipoprotein-releasing system permease protein